MVLRILKSVAMFALVFFSLRYLGFESAVSITVSLIPLVLGGLGVFVSEAFSLAAIVFIVAALSAFLPSSYVNGVDFAKKAIAPLVHR